LYIFQGEGKCPLCPCLPVAMFEITWCIDVCYKPASELAKYGFYTALPLQKA